MKKILLISGSVRNGNCKAVLEDIQQKFWLEHSTELLYLRDYDITSCHGCMHCRNTEKNACAKGDKVHLIIEKILDADITVLATPNYFYNMSGLTKNFVDKTVPYYELKTLVGKKFIFVYTGEDNVEETKAQLDVAFWGLVDCHELNNLGSFAYQTTGLNQFTDNTKRQETTDSICNLIRETLLAIDSEN